ncbi:proline--tRNA ligase [Candidatus Woesearchaeota archaeon]|nr:MAG: proline--tRNA ligase [Candidatus Woesearchaeota archaeon]
MADSTQGLTVKKSQDISEWYTQVIQKAELADYTDVSGCMIFRPRVFAIWEKLTAFFDAEIKKMGVQNTYFPLFIPEKLLTKEAEHVEGFAPEVAWVTHGGHTPLGERLAIRPTSETIMYDAFSKWIQSYRDLPLKINQWVNVVRWEFKHPVPFLRGREFLWQEGHTAFADKKDAEKEVLDILELYRRVFEELLAVPVIKGRKSENEKFAGADYSTSVETLTPSGKAVQAATSHHLGQRFAKSFNINFLDENGKKAHPYQNSWGFSTRSIGAMILFHGDDKGIIIPPRVAPLHCVIVPIMFDDSKEKVVKKCHEIAKIIEKTGTSVLVDDRDHYTPGWKFNEHELKGVCLRLEVGPKDLEKGHAVVVRRDLGKKTFVPFGELAEYIPKELERMQHDLFKNAQKFIAENNVKAENWRDFAKAIEERKLIYAPWCCTAECAEHIKSATEGAKCLTLPFDQPQPKGKCVKCDKPATAIALFAKSY